MTRTMARGLFLTVLATTLLLAGAAGAQSPCRAPQAGPMAGGDRGCGAVLNLTDKQQERVDEIHARGQQERAEIQKEMMRLRNELHGQMLLDEPDEQAVARVIERMGEARTRMQKLMVGMRMAVRAELTPEQRDKAMLHGCGPLGGRGAGRGARGAGFGGGDGCCCCGGGGGMHGEMGGCGMHGGMAGAGCCMQAGPGGAGCGPRGHGVQAGPGCAPGGRAAAKGAAMVPHAGCAGAPAAAPCMGAGKAPAAPGDEAAPRPRLRERRLRH